MGILLAASGILLNVLSVSSEVTILDYLSRLAVILFLLLATWSGLRQVVFSEEMNSNRIYGAICIYLLLGVTWSLLYNLLHTADAGAFSGAITSSSRESDVQWLYYSFVTLTTLGFGDILPVGPVARTLANAEAVFGVFYMAILVAMLVSAYAADRQRNN
ncbi:MAG: potassium channel family protein [Gammaproteobacteria bacterium]|nr:potassium channel family protein [Gammaproteobacteria bacterium]MDH4316261.1 potassium channel family protein [Gammaproteobacteria bacterium]MDH5501523.1 potassium channel family protein [Gammaproteobacteria bacterium]